MRCFNYTCQGESHKSTNKECQDYSLTWQSEDGNTTIAIVCDGHGGSSYFRSATGAQFAAEITLQQIQEFLSVVNTGTFSTQSLISVGTVETVETETGINGVMRRLFESIYYHWRNAITEDGKREITEWEQANVEQKYLHLLDDENRIVKAYGCTLMAYVQTKEFWFAFHLGDGKMVMLDAQYTFSQPVPWDEKCFLNKTTSLCGSEPIKDFRFCVQGNGAFPVAIFLGSDGIDDTFGDGSKLYSFYGDVIKELATQGQESVETTIKEDLPQLSRIGSQDDMSVAVVYDESKVKEVASAINDYQKSLVEQEMQELLHQKEAKESFIEDIRKKESSIPTPSFLESLKERIKELEEKIQSARDEYKLANQQYETTNLDKMRAEARMAEKELVRVNQQLQHLQEKQKKLESFTL